MEIKPGQLNVKRALSLLDEEGYPRQFVEKYFPSYWSDEFLQTSSGVLQYAFFLKQRFGLSVAFGDDGILSIQNDLVNVRYKHRADTRVDELRTVKRLGTAISSLSFHASPSYVPLNFLNPLELRRYILNKFNAVKIDFEVLLSFCWHHGIPVLFLENLPQAAKRMTGMVVNLQGRPAITLGFRHQQKGRQLFVLAHELGHILLGHVADGMSLVDEDLNSKYDTLNEHAPVILDAEERQADDFALALIRGEAVLDFRSIPFSKYTTLAVYANRMERIFGIDASHTILSYAFESGDWGAADVALKLIKDSTGALELIKQYFFQHTALQNLSDDSKSFLLSLQGYQ